MKIYPSFFPLSFDQGTILPHPHKLERMCMPLGWLFYETNIIKRLNKSIDKMSCENYLFKDYHWKYSMTIWNLDLLTSGRTQ